MELPARLRAAIDAVLAGSGVSDLKAAGRALSERYRAEIRDGRAHVANRAAANAYLATRLPATYAAVRASLGMAMEHLPGFVPRSLLDVGAGPGTAFFAAADCFPELASVTLVEASAAMRAAGSALADALDLGPRWIAADATAGLSDAPSADLVTLAYVLDELEPASRQRLVARLWEICEGVLVIVEPGTPAGWRRILAARDILVGRGACLVAPCPHALACPVAPPDWCHFAERLPRSRLHRQSKGADAPFEDEKFSFLAAARNPAEAYAARVLARPRNGSGRVQLKLCDADGALSRKLVTRRDGDAFRMARRLDWGDPMEALPG
jgi:ribosomal protein RSM22 (predicted rRNA methylase)